MNKRLAATDLDIRWAQPEDAAALALLVESGPLALDWTHPLATRGWLVADHKGAVLGCCQLMLGQPIGQIERLHVDPTLDARESHVVMRELTRVGLFSLRQTGSQVATSFVNFGNKGVKRSFKKWFGAAATQQGNLMVANLMEQRDG